MNQKAMIIGGGITGLCTAIALQRIGLKPITINKKKLSSSITLDIDLKA
ncbi:hypothetical protein [Brevibacillus daliensis]|nr:hypothetical protein [Brevibacillus daliensis]